MHPDYEYDRHLHMLASLTAKGIASYAASPDATGLCGPSFSEELLGRAYLDLLERRGMPPELKCYPSIQLQSGVFYDFLEPEKTPIDPADIASGLSKLCRCTGQVLGYDIYSIAQHCSHAHDIAPQPLKFKALMHDSPEGVLGDIATPLKQLLVDYKIIETRVTNAFAKQFSLPATFEDEVKHIDLRMAATEKRDIMPPGPWKMLEGIEPYSFSVLPVWSPRRACEEWLSRFTKSYQDYLESLEVE
jgi:hypothetical protein